MRVGLVLLGAALVGCSLETGAGCPSDLVAEPNGRDGNLFFVGGGYVQDRLWKQLRIPMTLQPDSFTVTTATVEFHEPVCVVGSSGFPLFDANGNLLCDFDVDVSTSSNQCTLPPVRQELNGLTLETTSKGTNVVLGVQTTAEGIAIQVGCDLSLTGGVSDPECGKCNDSGVRVVLREPDGDVRYEDTIWITCAAADKFALRYDRLVGETSGSMTGEGTVHVGDEFYVRYNLSFPQGSPIYDHPIGGQGMVAADANPPFEIVAYENLPSTPRRVLLRALAPADRPRMVAGPIEAVLPVTILP